MRSWDEKCLPQTGKATSSVSLPADTFPKGKAIIRRLRLLNLKTEN